MGNPHPTPLSIFKRFACCHRPFAHVPALTYGRRGGARATAATAAPSASTRACVPLTGTGDAAGVIEESNESNPARSAHMPALRILMQPLHTPSPSLQHACTSTHRGAALTGRPQPAHSFTITATCMHKHTQRGSTYRTPSTFRLPKLLGRVAS